MNLKPGQYTLKVDENGTKRTFDANGNEVYFKNPDGYEEWWEYDANGNIAHFKNPDGYEEWWEYDANGNEIHFKNSNGYEQWWEYDANRILVMNSFGCEAWYDGDWNPISKEQYDAMQKSCEGRVVEIDGVRYKLSKLP